MSESKTTITQEMMSIRIGYNQDDKISMEVRHPHGLETDHPKMVEILKKHAEKLPDELGKYCDKALRRRRC